MNISEFTHIFAEHPTLKKLAQNLSVKPTHKALLKGLSGSEPWFFIAHIFKQIKSNVVIVLPDSDEASYVHSDLASIIGSKKLIYFPSAHKRSIQYNQPDRTNMLLRTEALEKLSDTSNTYIIITSPEAIIEKVITSESFKEKIHFLHVGEHVDSHFINELLYEFGFERVDFVVEPGQFSVREVLLTFLVIQTTYRIE